MNNSIHSHELHDDDELRGHILSRRQALMIFGGGALAFLTGCGGGSSGPSISTTATPIPSSTAVPGATATPIPTSTGNLTCIATPALTEGPYFVDERLNRSDIRADTVSGIVKTGAVMALQFNVYQISSAGCAALTNAMVDVWHTDALGKYSDEQSEGTSGQKFLRGFQTTDAQGGAAFTTIFPGWYQGRAVHIHFKIRATLNGATREFNSQLFFPDAFTTALYASTSPYNTRGTRSTFNSNDGIYSQSGGKTLITPSGSASSGLSASFNVALTV